MIVCIANPASAGGKTRKRIPDILQALKARCGASVMLLETRGPGDARAFANRQAMTRTECRMVVIGGDGTLQEVANGLMTVPEELRKYMTLGLLSSGTGQGFAQSISLPPTINEQIELLVRGNVRACDVGRLRISDASQTPRTRYFVNECQLGIGGEVVRKVETGKKRHGGRLTFGLQALSAACTHPNQRIQISTDTMSGRSLSILGLVIGNGEFTGGGMNLTPGATPWDGSLDLLIMHSQGIAERISNLTRIYSARHVGRQSFELHRVRHLDVTSSDTVTVEADGEPMGSAPVTIDVMPRALRVIASGGRP